MSAGLLGPVALWAAILFAVLALVVGRRWALVASAIASSFATGVLAVALLASDFSLAYVAETTSLSTPWPYRLSALWGGMDGSMLVYSAMALALCAASLRKRIPIRVAGAVASGLLLITMFFANPFEVLDLPVVDGTGLLAILQHPAMIYHPPILYLGLTSLLVPFAMTVGLALGGMDRAAWMARTRRWLYLSWTLLTLGMAAGANWAYVELGWGGYWAWDPVENTALMPWIATTVFLHTSRIEDGTARMRRCNVLFAGLPFALSVIGVYLTRSGATGSIHSFAEDPVVGRVLLISAAVVASFVLILAIRSEHGRPWGEFRLDRDSWLLINALLLTTALVFISAGSVYPAFASVFVGESVAVDNRFFVVTVLPIAVAIAASMGWGLLRRWRVITVVAMSSAVIGWAVGGSRVGLALLAPAAGSFVALTSRMVRQLPRGRILTAYLAHVGMSLFLVAVAASSFGGDFTGSMRPGETVSVGGHELTLRSVSTGETDRFLYAEADFDLDGSRIVPQIRAYESQGLPVAEPALRSTAGDDVIVAISLLFPDAETVEVSVFVRPFVTWVWVGAALIGLGGLVALFSKGGAAATPHRPARAERPPVGTTSGTASR